MAQDNFGKHWELAEQLTAPGGKINLNKLKPMGFAFQTLAQVGTFNISINGINWVKTDGSVIEAASFGPVLAPANLATFYWVDDTGALQSGSAFPNPTLTEFFALAKIVTDGIQVTELHQYGNPTQAASGSGSISGLLVGVRIIATIGQTVYPLPFLPVNTSPESFIVAIGGGRLVSIIHYIYNAAGPSIDFTGAFTAIAGDVVSINYQKA